ncbi:RND transporter [Planctomicrobium sp. SH668]|uniref:RND transporter n=1 Tax=Planctomicrobium sp. SH668 TaxID=3448126 RepID=UPI003F5B9F53
MKATILTTSLLTLTAIFAVGCGQSATPQLQTEKHADAHDHTASTETGSHDHSGWWCNEHGIPEEVCSMCSTKAAADFQKKGDWCKEHDRADSQCFKCHPELEAKFAAQYEAKFGKQPPTPEG